jgi:hypothetical protein
MEVTRDQLAKALDHQWVYAKNREGTHHAQIDASHSLVSELWGKLADQQPEPEPGDVVDAHICCEHIAEDPEVSAMARILRLMEARPFDPHAVIRALYPLDGPALPRVLRWFLARFPDPGDPPF